MSAVSLPATKNVERTQVNREAAILRCLGSAMTVCTVLLALGGLGRPAEPLAASAAQGVRYAPVATWLAQPRAPWQAWAWPPDHQPGGLAWDADRDRLLVVDRTDGAVRIYDEQGQPTGLLGPGAGAFEDPRNVAVLPDGRVAVSDAGVAGQPGRLSLFDAAGTTRTAAWTVDDPRGVAATQRGEIGVVEGGTGNLRLFDHSGRLLASEMLDELAAPEGLAYRGDVAGTAPPMALFDVADATRGELLRVRLGGTRRSSVLDRLRGLRGASAWQEGASQYWLAAVAEQGLLVMTKDGAEIDRLPFADVWDVEVAAEDGVAWATVEPQGLVRLADLRLLLDRHTDTFGKLLEPRRVAVGDVVLLGDGAPRVQLWSKAGEPQQDVRFTDRGVGTPLLGLGALPAEDVMPPVDVAADGAFGYVLWRSGRIRRVGPAGFDLTWEPERPDGQWSVALDAFGGRVAVFDLVAQTVRLFDAALQEADAWPVVEAGAKAWPDGDFRGASDLALADAAVLLVDPYRWTVDAFSLDGQPRWSQTVDGRPLRVAAAADGTAFVLTEVGWVHVYAPNGEPRGAFPVGGAGARPTDVALDEAGLLYVTDARGEVRLYAADPDAPAGMPLPGEPGGCSAVAYKTADPPVIDLGEEVEVQLVVDGACPSEDDAADIVLTIDRSGSMTGPKIWAAKAAAIGFVLQIDAPRSRLGLVSFATDTTRDRPLSDDVGEVVRGIGNLRAGGSTNLVEALQEARLGHRDSEPRLGNKKIIIFLSDGRHEVRTVSLGELNGVIDRVRAQGITVFTIGLGADADANTLRRMATDDSHYYFSPTEDELEDIYAQIAGRLRQTPLFEDVVVRDVVPANMRYLPGSATPFEPEWDPVGRVLTWRLGRIDAPGFRLSYRLEPLEGGVWATNVSAVTDHVDGRGKAGALPFPVPFVRVRAPQPTPTPTPSPTNTPTPTVTPTPTPTNTPTPTPTNTPTPTPTNTPTPSPTPTPMPHPIYVPIVHTGRCEKPRDGLDIVLVVDTSSSMKLPTHEGGPMKVTAAVAAAREFVRLMTNPDDRLGAVQFNNSARVLSELTRDREAVRESLHGVTVQVGTRIDAGLDTAGGVLARADYDPDRRPVIVLLTDGRPTASRASHVFMAAQRLRGFGVTVYAIGLGPDADPNLLRILATSPGYYFFAPGTQELTAVYRQVAAKIPPPCE